MATILAWGVDCNGQPHSPSHWDELEIIPGTQEALASLRSAGYRLIVATNQSNVVCGLQTKEMIESMHERLGASFSHWMTFGR